MSLAQVLDDLAAYLEFEIDEGRGNVEIEPRVVAELGAPSLARPERSAPTPGGPAPTLPAPVSGVRAGLGRIAADVAQCTKCALHRTRSRTVPGQGCDAPEILFVGEGPGADEDRLGLAFVGKAGQVLSRMIQAMGLTRDEVFIANVVKCRPPGNRLPLPEERAACLPYLKAQIALLKPKVIVALGAVALDGLLGLQGISRLRGTWLAWNGIDLMPTFHPSHLLQQGGTQAYWQVWEDMLAVLSRLGRQPLAGAKKRTAAPPQG